MRFNNTSSAIKYAQRQMWNRWFAWYPVRLSPTKIIWWEWVERKGEFSWDSAGGAWDYEYRLPGEY